MDSMNVYRPSKDSKDLNNQESGIMLGPPFQTTGHIAIEKDRSHTALHPQVQGASITRIFDLRYQIWTLTRSWDHVSVHQTARSRSQIRWRGLSPPGRWHPIQGSRAEQSSQITSNKSPSYKNACEELCRGSVTRLCDGIRKFLLAKL